MSGSSPRCPSTKGSPKSSPGGAASGKGWGVHDLAAVSRSPMIPVARPSLGQAEFDAIRRPLSSGWLTQGPEVAAFEREFAAFVGAPFACAVSNCTTALHLALRAVGVEADDEVITVSHSFIATANAIRYCGAVPVFVDVQPDTYNMDPTRVRAAISEKTKAILVVHQLGMPCDLESIVTLARALRLPVIEDAACAAGSEILWNGEWQRIGRPAHTIPFPSSRPPTALPADDVGMITPRTREGEEKVRLGRQHALRVSATPRHSSSRVVFEEYAELGFNYRMT